MRFNIFYLYKGTIDFPLKNFYIKYFHIKSVKFVTNNKNYELQFFKYNPQHKKYEIFVITPKDKINGKYFDYYTDWDNDSNNSLIIMSSCDGILEFKYREQQYYKSNIINEQFDKIKKKASTKFYSQFYSVITEDNLQISAPHPFSDEPKTHIIGSPYLFINEQNFKNYKYYTYDIEFFNYMADDLLKERIEVQTDNIIVRESMRGNLCDIILGFDIDSYVDTTCQIYRDNELIFSFPIKKGFNYYPCLITCAAIVWSGMTMKFTNKINMVKFREILADSNLRSLLTHGTVVIKHGNGIMTWYAGLMGPFIVPPQGL